MSRSRGSLPETQVIIAWRHQLLNGERLVTEDGRKIAIIYPGRPNDERGADFRDAVISIDGRIVKGDIEVHVLSSSWREHGHHRDSAYNRVVLHVVMWHNTKRPARLQNGREVPVLALEKYIKLPVSQSCTLTSYPSNSNVPCSGVFHYRESSALVEFLNNAGEKRFLEKVAGFKKDFARIGADQLLYQGIMGALGYSRNKLPFLELARRLPLRVLESIAGDEIPDEDYLVRQQTLLLETAGLLPTRCNDGEIEKRLENKQANSLVKLRTRPGHRKRMSPDDWNMFKVRPSNSPLRRLVAMSSLLLLYREKGLLQGLIGLVEEVPADRGYQRLERGLRVNALGSGRAAEIIVNVLLPFTFAWSGYASRPELGRKAMHLFRHYPRLAVNSVEKHMSEQLGLNRDLVNSAAGQQGLIHIYNNLCTQGRCEDCELGKFESRNYI